MANVITTLCRGVIATAILAALTACQSESVIAPATGRSLELRGKGELLVYADASNDASLVMIDSFRRANPDVAVSVVKPLPGVALDQIFGEFATPRPDVYVTMDVPKLAANESLFEARNTELLARVPKNLRSPAGAWTAVTVRPYVVIYNSALVAANDVPKALEEVADAKWKGKVALTDGSSWLMLLTVAMMQRDLGETQAQTFVRALAANAPQWHKEQTDVAAAVVSGKARIGVVTLGEAYKSIQTGAPLGYQYLECNGKVLSDSVNVAINKRSPNLRNARLFADFVLSGEAQQRIADENRDMPVMLGVQMAQGVKPLSMLKVTPVPFAEIAAGATRTREMLSRAGIP